MSAIAYLSELVVRPGDEPGETIAVPEIIDELAAWTAASDPTNEHPWMVDVPIAEGNDGPRCIVIVQGDDTVQQVVQAVVDPADVLDTEVEPDEIRSLVWTV